MSVCTKYFTGLDACQHYDKIGNSNTYRVAPTESAFRVRPLRSSRITVAPDAPLPQCCSGLCSNSPPLSVEVHFWNAELQILLQFGMVSAAQRPRKHSKVLGLVKLECF